MSGYIFDTTNAPARNRLTVAFRSILVIPHLIVSYVWGIVAQVVGIAQWFIAVFTGQRNQGIWDMQRQWLDYTARVYGYASLLYDPYPAFGTAPGPVPVTTSIDIEQPANRLTVGLRFLWAIPAMIIATVLAIAGLFVALVAWVVIIITGKHPQGMWDFMEKVLKYSLQTNAYTLLMTDTYPKYGV